MANITITNIDTGSVLVGGNEFADGALTGTSTQAFLAGTILARELISSTMTATITGTGTHVLAVASKAGRNPQLGAYTLLAGTLSSGVGAWTLTAPDGQTETLTTSSKTAAMPFPRLGLSITPAAAGTDFVTADSVAFTVAVGSFPFVAFVKDTGTNGAQTPVAVLTYPVTLSGGTAQIRACVAGRVDADRLIIAADGTGANVTAAVKDALRDSSIIPIRVTQMAKIDNPQ